MTLAEQLTAVPALVAAVLMLGAALLASCSGRGPAMRTFTFFCLAVALWCLGSGLAQLGVAPEQQEFWLRLEHVGLAAAGPLWLLFAGSLTQRVAPGRSRWWLFAVPLVSLALMLSGDAPGESHDWWVRFILTPYSYGLVLAGLALLVEGMLRLPAYRPLLLGLVGASLLPLAAGLLDASGARAFGVELTPNSWAIAGFAALCLLARYRALQHSSLAVEQLMAQLPDAVCVLDEQNRVMSSNSAAQRLLGARPGQHLRELLPTLPAQALAEGDLRLERLRVGERVLDLRFSPLRREAGGAGGHVLTLRDVSLQAEAADRLAQQTQFQEAMLDCIHLLLDSETDAKVYQHVLEQAIQVVPGAEAGSVALRGEDGSFAFAAAVGFDLSVLSQLRLEPHELYYGQALGQRPVLMRSLASFNEQQLEPEKAELLKRAGPSQQVQVSMAVPVSLNGELLAVLSLDNLHDPQAFDDEAQWHAEAFAKHIGAVLQKAQLKARLSRAAEVQTLLARVERLLLQSDSLQVFFPLLADLLIESSSLPVDQLVIFELGRNKTLRAHVHARDTRRDRAVAEALAAAGLLDNWDRNDNLLRLCLDSQQPFYIEDAWQERNWIRLEANPSRSVFYCPLLQRGEIWGVMEFSADVPKAFGAEARDVLLSIAHSAELTLSRQRDREQLELEVAKLTTVVATGDAMRELRSRQQVYDEAVTAVLHRTRATLSTVLLYEPDTNSLYAPASRRADGDDTWTFSDQRLARGEGMAWRAFEANRPLRISDPAGLKEVRSNPALPPTRDYLAVPLRDHHNQPIGVLVASLAGREAQLSFEASDLAFVDAIAQATSSALTRLSLLEQSEARAEAYQELYRASKRQARELELLDRVRTAVARQLDLNEVIRTVVEGLSETFGYALVSIYWLEAEELVLRHQVGYEREVTRLPYGQGVMGRAVRSAKPLLVEDVSRDPDYREGSNGVKSEIAVPLYDREHIVGVLNIETLGGTSLDEADLKLVVALSEQVSIAIERALLYSQVRSSEQRFRLLAENMSDVVCLHAPDGSFRYPSPSVQAVLGYAPEALLGRSLSELLHPEDILEVRSSVRRLLRGLEPGALLRYRIRHSEGHYLWFESVAQPLFDAARKVQGFTSSSRDVTERREMEERLRNAALYDDLTGLANRTLFLDRLEQALRRRSPSGLTAVLFLDLDRFKAVNDSLGHQAGDALLEEVGRRLRAQVRPEDTVARLAGDEFCVLLETCSKQEALEISARLRQALTRPFALEGREVATGVSIGIAFASAESSDAQQLLRDADIAMYRAKQDRRVPYLVFDAAMYQQLRSRLDLESDLRRALEQRELQLVFQPIYALRGGQLAGAEALCRWTCPSRGAVAPDLFIPLAEETGLITELDLWVLREACAQVAAWEREVSLPAAFSLSVNFSAQSFETADLAARLRHMLEEAGLAPKRLQLEVTERTLMRDAELALAVLADLQELGVQVRVDDFGTGHSSLPGLHTLPLGSLKVDRGIVGQLGSERNGIILRSILALAAQLGLEVVAEGVETERQLEQLRALGCQYGQGYLLGRPLSAQELLARLRTPQLGAQAGALVSG